ncbi:hypothetical protein SNEBB_001792 [Seison nebaliae]|nr:hypothetical protein SNEBB_001792 [Seison nebaliae]
MGLSIFGPRFQNIYYVYRMCVAIYFTMFWILAMTIGRITADKMTHKAVGFQLYMYDFMLSNWIYTILTLYFIVHFFVVRQQCVPPITSETPRGLEWFRMAETMYLLQKESPRTEIQLNDLSSAPKNSLELVRSKSIMSKANKQIRISGEEEGQMETLHLGLTDKKTNTGKNLSVKAALNNNNIEGSFDDEEKFSERAMFETLIEKNEDDDNPMKLFNIDTISDSIRILSSLDEIEDIQPDNLHFDQGNIPLTDEEISTYDSIPNDQPMNFTNNNENNLTSNGDPIAIIEVEDLELEGTRCNLMTELLIPCEQRKSSVKFLHDILYCSYCIGMGTHLAVMLGFFGLFLPVANKFVLENGVYDVPMILYVIQTYLLSYIFFAIDSFVLCSFHTRHEDVIWSISIISIYGILISIMWGVTGQAAYPMVMDFHFQSYTVVMAQVLLLLIFIPAIYFAHKYLAETRVRFLMRKQKKVEQTTTNI